MAARADVARPCRAASTGCRGRTIATSPGSWPRTGVPARPDAQQARLASWDGITATVEHDGPCDLVIARTYDPGWLARVDDGPERSVLPVNGGFQAVRLDGAGSHRVSFRYRTPRMALWGAISIVAASLEIAAAVGLLVAGARARGRSAR